MGRSRWSNQLGFILAASGSAIGLGNIWKFPYITGVNGGGAFVLVYLLCIAAVGIPILVAEVYIGKTSQSNAIKSFEKLDREGSPWRHAGLLGIVSAFLILSFYSVVGGWVLDYEFMALTGKLGSMPAEEMEGLLGSIRSSPGRMALTHTLFMVMTVLIVVGGISGGIERAAKILMPTLMVILVGLFIYAMTLDGFGKSMAFLFSPDFSKLTWGGVLEAVGHSFFTLSLGMGAMITYGSYMGEKQSVLKTAGLVAFLDTIIALIAGAVIFAVVFTFDQEPSSGPGLMFAALPALLAQLPGMWFLSSAFFLLVGFAALSSAISLLEVVVSYWTEARGWSRKKAAIVIGAVIWALGLLCALSLQEDTPLKIMDTSVFDIFDKATSKIFLPVGGMVISLYFGWVLGEKHLGAIFPAGKDSIMAQGFLWTTRVIAPVAVVIMLVNGLLG